MSPVLEKLLKEAEKLSPSERSELADRLTVSTEGQRDTKTNGLEPNFIRELREWVDALETSDSRGRNSSARVAEKIRRSNDRDYKL